uniref:Uncharacterized protein n=1 Tax=Corethron hystrix TaxID=216773 RepID=A0A7S1BUE3_9STRA
MNNAEDKPIPRSELVDLREEIRAEMTAEIKREIKREIEGSSLKDSSEREGLISDNSDYVHSLPGHSDTLLIAAQNQKYSENTLVSASRRQEIMQLQKEDIERMIRDGIQRRLEEIGIGGSPANMVPVRREIEADTELEIEVIPIGHERSINEAVGTPPSPPPQQHQRTGILGKCLSMAGRLLGVGSDSPRKDINTGTLGMYAVAVAVHPSACTNHRARAWLTAVMFLFFVMMETFVFLMVSLESVSPICNSVDDCLPGTYCYIEKGIKLGTCRDCAYGQKPDDKICSAIFSSEMWEKRDYAIDADYNTLPLGKTFLDLDKNYDKYQCLASHHCSETDVDAPNYTNNHCDYIVQNTDKIDGATYIVIAFFSLLWSLSICEDFEESTIEEMVLDHYIKDSLSGPATIIRIALCIQKYFIPFYAIGSTIVLLITDPISAKSVILNLLAIGVLLEADNVIAVLFLNRQHEEIMEWAAGGVGDEVSIAARKSFFWTRVHGISCAVLLVIELSYIQNVKDCSDYFSSFIFGLYYFPPFVIFLWQFFVSVLCMRRNSPSIYKRMIEGLSELFFNLFVMSSQVFPSWIALTIRDDPFKNSSQFQSYYIWSIVCLLIFVGLLMLRRRCYRGAEMEQTEATDRSRMVRT